MLIAAFFSILLRANILVAVPMVWFSNPITMGPMFYVCYLVGAAMLGLEPQGFHFDLSIAWLVDSLAAIWQPFLLGCLVVGGITSLLAFFLVRILWHMHILRHIRIRARRRHNRRRQVHGKR